MVITGSKPKRVVMVAATVVLVAVPISVIMMMRGNAAPRESTIPTASQARRIIPPHPWQTMRAAVLSSESIEKTIENLGGVEDVHLAETSVEGFTWDGKYQNEVVTNLARVRRILALGSKNRDEICPIVLQKLERTLDEWEVLFREFKAAATSAYGWENEFDQVELLRIRAMGTIYTLSELDYHEALPTLMRAFRLYKRHEMMMPTAPALLVIAIHKLMLTYPVSELTEEGLRRRQEYLDRARSVIPPAAYKQATTWDAEYDESDPRFRVLPGLLPVLLRDQPMMLMRVYPDTFVGGDQIGDWQGVPDPRAIELVDLVEKFLQAVETPSPWSL